MSRGVAILAVCALFLSGVAIGALGMHLYYAERLMRPGEPPAMAGRFLSGHLMQRLDLSGIPTTWVSRDARTKEKYDLGDDRISLISIHSSKGLDYELVYLLGIDHIHPTPKTRKTLMSLIYVAMTRAKYRLIIPYVRESGFIKKMKACIPGG